MKNLIQELINQGHSEDTIVHFLEMEGLTVEEGFEQLNKVLSK